MLRHIGVFGLFITVALAGCSDPAPDLGDPEELAFVMQMHPFFDLHGPLNVLEASEGSFLLVEAPGCGDAPTPACAPAMEQMVASSRFNETRFDATWTIHGDGLDQPVATGSGQQVAFAMTHATTYHGTVTVVDRLSNETLFTRTGQALAVWHFVGDVEAPAGPASRVTLAELPTTLAGQTLHATVTATPQVGPEADAQVFVVFPDGSEETVAAGAEVRLGAPGTYLLQWQAVMPLQTPHTLHVETSFFVEGAGAHDGMMME